MAYNVSFHRALQTSPYIFKYGKHPVFDIDKKLLTKIPKIDQTLQELKSKKNLLFKQYSEKNIQKGSRKLKQDIDVGDYVVIYKENKQSKFDSHWQEGYRVKEKIHEDAFVVTNGIRNYRLNRIHLRKVY